MGAAYPEETTKRVPVPPRRTPLTGRPRDTGTQNFAPLGPRDEVGAAAETYDRLRQTALESASPLLTRCFPRGFQRPGKHEKIG
jgi:hypothetical protein